MGQQLAVGSCSEWLHTRTVAMSSERAVFFHACTCRSAHCMKVKSGGQFRFLHDVPCTRSTGNGPKVVQFLCFKRISVVLLARAPLNVP